VLQCVAVCCSVLQRVVLRCSESQLVVVCSVRSFVGMSVMQCVAYVAACYSELQ